MFLIKVISRIMYLYINLSRIVITHNLKLGIFFKSNRGITSKKYHSHCTSFSLPRYLNCFKSSKVAFLKLLVKIYKITSQNTLWLFTFRPKSIIVSVALVVFEIYELYFQTKAVSFNDFLVVSGLSSHKSSLCVDVCLY